MAENPNDDETAGVNAEELNHRYWQERLARCELQQEVAQLKNTIEQMQGSKSWKITAPLRALAHWLSPTSTDTKKKQSAPLISGAIAERQSLNRYLYVDVSSISTADYRGGIEHVVRGMLGAMLAKPWPHFEIIPIRYVDSQGYVSAAQFLYEFCGLSSALAEGSKVQPRQGDVFLGLDFLRRIDEHFSGSLQLYKNAGVKICFFVYDLLPLTMNDKFPAEIVASYKKWLDTITQYADTLFFISQHARDEYLQKTNLPRAQSIEKHVVPMGINSYWIEQSKDQSAIPAKAATVVLMVGTIEPRKQHMLAIQTFEQLWREGHDVELRILGRKGWQADEIVEAIEQAVVQGKKITWIQNATDADVYAEYRSASALLNLSLAEGYGLPLIEAAAFGLPLILNDIPVFREVARDAAHYVARQHPEYLAEEIARSLQLDQLKSIDSKQIKVHNWAECADVLRKQIALL